MDRYFIWVVNAARRFVQAIAGSFETFGPLIAIGEPGEKLPQIGAAAHIFLTGNGRKRCSGGSTSRSSS